MIMREVLHLQEISGYHFLYFYKVLQILGEIILTNQIVMDINILNCFELNLIKRHYFCVVALSSPE